MNQTALLLFSRSGGAEALVKNLLPSHHALQNKKLVQKIVDRSVALAQSSALPFFVWDEQRQQGAHFGEKLVHAVDQVFQQGYQNIIIIGNDCLSLKKDHINQAVSGLQNHASVIAPTKKGGAYLIGINKTSFNKKTFAAIRWQTAFVYEDLQNLFLNDSCIQLPLLDDVNHFNDLKKQVRKIACHDSFRMYALSVIAFLATYFSSFAFFAPSLIVRFVFGLKAPPSHPLAY